MRWEKKGLIYCPNREQEWEFDTFTTPHAMLIKPGVIRIWGGVRDANGVSRIKYIDVDEKNPKKILYISEKPSLDIGNKGCFDDNGVILGDIVPVGNKLYMYYVGFQLTTKVKFQAFSGVAISEDGGESFERYSEVPILDRTDTGRFGRCIHTVIKEDDLYKCYYAVINDWKEINGIMYPVYNIWYTTSEDGIHFSQADTCLCVDVHGDEYRIGRPKVYKTDSGYEMFYTRDLITKEYLAGYAVSEDGIHWDRKDELLNLEKSNEGWDSQMACYPVKIVTETDTWLFYNGNGMGKTGVGFAKLSDETKE